jgi:hypothetical protein
MQPSSTEDHSDIRTGEDRGLPACCSHCPPVQHLHHLLFHVCLAADVQVVCLQHPSHGWTAHQHLRQQQHFVRPQTVISFGITDFRVIPKQRSHSED